MNQYDAGFLADIRNASSYDEPYTWGRPPSTYLAPRQVARLLLLRSQVRVSMSLDAKPAAPRHVADCNQDLS